VNTSLDEKDHKQLVSYQFDRFSFKGEKDNVTLNIIDTSSSKLQSLYLHKMKQTFALNEYLNNNCLVVMLGNNPNININNTTLTNKDEQCIDTIEDYVVNDNTSFISSTSSNISSDNEIEIIDVFIDELNCDKYCE
jgi:hypothetical protein